MLSSLSKLPESIKRLDCGKNKLTSLPNLPEDLILLYCRDNQINYLPDLPDSLIHFGCDNNPIYSVFSATSLLEIQSQIRMLSRVRYLIYCLKYKKQLRQWLWVKVRLPKIQDKYHPDNLKELLVNVSDDDEDGFNTAIDTW